MKLSVALLLFGLGNTPSEVDSNPEFAPCVLAVGVRTGSVVVCFEKFVCCRSSSRQPAREWAACLEAEGKGLWMNR